ncbi:hypothetical protein AZE42_08484 [Rhizopogon vesiculosus]|uniref:Uncharacterized protein n=1 Tax=Rhizopogon vesiculosus TaxID=180088 RepID=A0A1J8PQ04_9AGAM|nr:hypothetical protein AZE42_08484 [Rhizopogon vesiculosus]
MILLLLGVLLCISCTHAAPFSFNGTSIPALDVSDSLSCNDIRTLSDIIWGCTATLFACTWTAIHPNIPGMDERKVAIVLRRLFMMVIALLAPELIITWATLQFFSAQKATKDFNDTFGARYGQAESGHLNIGEEIAATVLPEISPSLEMDSAEASARKSKDGYRKWAVTHGFFAWMGGFLLYVNDKPRAPLTPDELHGFVSDGSVDMPDIAEADILDRSKGDELSKSVAMLQLVWFVIQLIARWVQKLPVTLLEVDTLAVAALTCIAYSWWWKKPKDVGRPYIVRWKAESPPTSLAYGKVNTKLVAGDDFSYFHYLAHSLFGLMGFEPMISPGAWHGVWRDTLFGLELFVSEAHRADIVACGFPWGIGHWKFLPSMEGFVGVVIVISSVAYTAARLTLIVLTVMSFQSLPSGVYNTVAWTKFIPHFVANM